MVRYVNDGTLQRGFVAFLIVLAVLVSFGQLGEGNRSVLSAPVKVGIESLVGVRVFQQSPSDIAGQNPI